ncbi:MAG: JAB domain-containing protein, partial [Eubacterium sp.]|nr:JAB domain-containing protein [Eubacterium sp.]
LISPAEIFRRALIRGAASIVLLHNHPSGVPTPSQEDMEVTKRVAACGEMLGIPLMDHIIIGDNRYYSFSEMDHIRTIDESYE